MYSPKSSIPEMSTETHLGHSDSVMVDMPDVKPSKAFGDLAVTNQCQAQGRFSLQCFEPVYNDGLCYYHDKKRMGLLYAPKSL